MLIFKKQYRQGGGGTNKIYRNPVFRKGAWAPTMLHMLLSVSVESNVIRQGFVLLKTLSASGHLASDARIFVSLLFPMTKDRKIFHGDLNPLSAALRIRIQMTTNSQILCADFQ
jgi:hypothetical protein